MPKPTIERGEGILSLHGSQDGPCTDPHCPVANITITSLIGGEDDGMLALHIATKDGRLDAGFLLTDETVRLLIMVLASHEMSGAGPGPIVRDFQRRHDVEP